MGLLRGAGLIRALAALFALLVLAPPAGAEWRELRPGLDLGRFTFPRQSEDGDSILTVLRVDPRRHRLALATARENDGIRLTARGWAEREGFAAAINAGLYARDQETHVGYMVHRGRVINPRLRTWGAILGLDPASERLPSARLIDRRCEDLEAHRRRYRTIVQNMRLFNCNGVPTWRPNEQGWSIAAIGQDGDGNILFLFSQSPYSVRAFAEMIRRLPIDIRRAGYLEGGSPAQLYVNTGGRRVEIYGTHGSRGSVLLPHARPIPNVIGVIPRD